VENVAFSIQPPSFTDEMQQALHILNFDGLVEIRIPQSGRTKVVRGYFDDFDAAVHAVEQYDGRVPGIYVNLNPIRRELLARAANRLEPYANTSVTDDDIVRRTWLPIDVDPIRASGISSSDAEHQAALDKAHVIKAWLTGQGWPEPIMADSGNGAHLLYRIDLPNDATSLQLCKSVLEAVAFEFDDEESTIDQTVANAARIWKLYGTMACKGDSLEDRPHRRARIISTPPDIEPAPAELLKQIALSEELSRSGDSPIKIGASLDVAGWLASHNLEVLRTASWKDGMRWVLKQCPFNSAHTDASAVVVKFGNGALSFRCHHNGCRDKKWSNLRRLFEPDYREGGSPKADASIDSPWPALELPEQQLPEVQPFDKDLLPDAFRGYIMDIAERLQCPPDFAAAAAMTFAGAVLGRRMGIKPKRHDDWLVVPNLWGAAIGRPGVMKTPAISQVVHFLNSLEQESRRTFQQARAEYERSNEIQIMDAENARRLAKEMMKKGAREEAERKLSEIPELAPGPTRTRYIVNDTTVEKLGEILAENANGVILVRDELVGFLKGLDKPGNDTQRAFMLEAWNGDGRFVYDRITRETVEIEAACVSIFGGIQPGPFAAYLKDALVNGSGDDGLMQRFQLVVWPDVSLEWRNVDRLPNVATREQMRRAFHFLATVESTLGERDEFDPEGIPFLRFDDDAQVLFDSWREELELTLRRGAEHAAIESHLSKYRSLIPSIALICHLVDAGAGPVSKDALARALNWGRYLETHVRRVYSVGMSADSSAAHELIKLIRRGKLSSPFRIRDVYRNEHRGLDKSSLVQTAVEMLESYGALRGVSVTDTGGRSVVEYHIHPELLGGKQ
jgi:hypothetical protein